jgi:hypothetical protein
VTLNQPRILVGEATTAVARVSWKGRSISTRWLRWSTGDAAVATVDSLSGAVTGVGPGTAEIIATVLGDEGAATLVVDAQPTPPVATHMNVTTQPGDAVAGATIAPQPRVEIRDAGGARVITSFAQVTATLSAIVGSGSLLGTTTATAVSGVATFTDLVVSGAGTYTLTFSSDGLPAAASVPFTISAAPQVATTIGISRQPGGAASGAPLDPEPVVEVRDGSNQRVTGSTASITVSIASGSGSLVGTTTRNAVDGVASFSDLRIEGAGTYRLTFASPGLSSATSESITITAPPPPPQVATQLGISAQPGGALADARLNPQPRVEIRDASGGIVASSTAPVTATITGGSGTLTGTATIDAVAGVAAFADLAISAAGTYTITFSSPGLQSVASTPVIITPPPPPPQVATQLGLSRQPGGAQAGAPLNPQPRVEVRDANNAVVAGSTAAVTATITGGSGTLSGTTTMNAAAGVAAFSNLAITSPGTYTVTFSSPGLASVTSAAVTITAPPPPPATRLAMVVQPPDTALSGEILAPAPAVGLRDANGAAVPESGRVVSVTIATGGGTLGGTLTATTNVNGVATFANVSISGTAGSRTLSFSATGLTSVVSEPVAITVPPPPPPVAGVLFQSDWSSALGTTDFAILDGARASPWTVSGGVGLEVIPATGLDFPSTNVLRATASVERSGFALLRKTGLPVPAAPFNRYYRWYYRHVKPSIAGGNNQHPVQDGNAQSDCNWTFNVNQIDNATYRVNFGVEGVFPNDRWFSPILQTNVTYRFEVHFVALSASASQLHVRVYDSRGVLLYDDDDFRNQAGTSTLASNPTFGMNNIANLDGLNAGVNGVVNLTQDVVHSYQGAFAVCSNGWCGPYVR